MKPFRNGRRHPERGDGDVDTLFKIMIGCLLISGVLGTMGWIKATKDARIAARQVQMLAGGERSYGFAVTYYPGICGSDEC